MTSPRPVTDIHGYHAHVYYRPDQRIAAAALRARIDEQFVVKLGRWHDRPVGPHPRAMYQVAFEVRQFADLVPWLALNRGELDVLVHPETGDDLADHRDHAVWLGEPLALRLHVFQDDARGTSTAHATPDSENREGGPS